MYAFWSSLLCTCTVQQAQNTRTVLLYKLKSYYDCAVVCYRRRRHRHLSINNHLTGYVSITNVPAVFRYYTVLFVVIAQM
jgi:hypothetical protein